MRLICKISHWIFAGVICAIAILAINSNAFAAEKTWDKWQEAYLEVMDGDDPKYKDAYCECRLVFLDDNDIPEFFIGDPLDKRIGGLYTYSDGKLIKLRDFGFRDFFTAYGEKSGIFRNDYYIDMAGSKTGIKFINMDKDTLTVFDELSYDSVNDIYKANGKVIDKKTYDKIISGYTLTNVRSDYMSFEKMKQHLLDSIDKENNSTTESTNTTQATTVTQTSVSQTTVTQTSAAQTTVTQVSVTKSTDAEQVKSSTVNNTANSVVSSAANVTTTSNSTISTASNSNSSSTTTKVTTKTTVTTSTKKASSPKTGDSEPVILELMVIGFITVGFITLLMKKQKKK